MELYVALVIVALGGALCWQAGYRRGLRADSEARALRRRLER